ncbi:MAG: hypothetical protein ACLURV_01290 [Gallintestinimicrobium sp.]
MLFEPARLCRICPCRACGYVCKCPHCDVSLSEHRGGRLVCHYCGYEQPAVKLCPSCGSKYILGFRAGTEAMEEQLHKMFPGTSAAYGRGYDPHTGKL